MGYKSRGNFPIKVCFKKCDNRDKKCNICVCIQGKMTEYKKPKNKSC